MSRDRLLLIDGHSQIYRAVFSPTPPLSSPSGEPTQGTYVFTRMLLRTLRELHPTYVAVAVDGARKDLERRKRFPGYKDRREGTPDESIYVQVMRMLEIIEALGLPIIRSKGWEADDVLATLTHRFKMKVGATIIATRDKDLHQLVDDGHLVGKTHKHQVVLYDPMSDDWTYKTTVMAKWGVRPSRVVEMQTLMGDPMDGVPGVRGIGPKRALDLIQKHGTVAALMECRDLPKSIRKALDGADIDLCRYLVQLNTRAPIVPDVALDDIQFTGPDIDRARPIFKELGFRRLAGVE